MTEDERKVWDLKYPKEKFSSKELNFTNRELIQLITLDNQAQLGKFSEMLFQNYLHQQVMPRIGITDTPDVGLMYDLDEGKLYVAQPLKPANPPPPPKTKSNSVQDKR